MQRGVRFAILGVVTAGAAAWQSSGTSGLRDMRGWNEAYVWQRSWTDEVQNSVLSHMDEVGGWRVLALEIAPDGRQFLVRPGFGTLQKAVRPVTAVVRIDGRAESLDREAIAQSVSELVQRWTTHGVRPSVEIDFDCATSKLDTYADLLARIRTRLTRETRISITALPSWLSSPSFAGLAALPDEVVLQVHAVRDPRLGLFDPVAAAGWVRMFAAASVTPFRVALPTYGARVTMSGEKVASVESEIDGLSGGGNGFEIVADPRAVSDFARQLRQHPVDGLIGLVWFRLPVPGDKRAWSSATWRAVVSGAPESYRARIEVETQPNGSRILALSNDSTVDALAPQRISFEGKCPTDGANGFDVDEGAGGPSLVRTQQKLLRASERRVIGWTRCQIDEEFLRVED